MGGMIVCDKVCLGVLWTSSLFSHKSQSSLDGETPEEGFMTMESSVKNLSIVSR